MAPSPSFAPSSDIDWDKVRIFYVAADAGSFTHAGDALSISQSAVSRQVSALERDLGVPLFHRHARGVCAELDRADRSREEMRAKLKK
jgi:DNA-binding transcriptional LysR family regulator